MEVEVEHPHRHHHPTGHRWLDFVLPISAVLISLVSIGIALHHGEVMQSLVQQNERLVQANSLPHLQLSGGNISEEGVRMVNFSVANRGVGPAEIRSVQVLVDGRAVGDLGQLVRACCGPSDASGLTNSTLLGTMIQPGQEVQYIRLPVSPATQDFADRLDQARKTDRIVTNLCYCSVFDECWTRSSKGFQRPARVRSCPMPQPQYIT